MKSRLEKGFREDLNQYLKDIQQKAIFSLSCHEIGRLDDSMFKTQGAR